MKFLRIILILVTLGAICILPLGCGSNTESVQQTVKVQSGNITTEITSVGNLEYSKTINLTCGIDCKVSEVLVQAGDSVKQGQVLCRFDEAAWQAEINTLANEATSALRNLTAKKLSVIQAQQSLAAAQTGLVAANNTILSLQIAYLQAQSALETAQTTLEKTKNNSSDPVEIQIAELQVKLAEGQLSVAKKNLDVEITYGMQAAQAAVDDGITALDNAQAAVSDAQTSSDNSSQILTDAKNTGPQVKATIDGLITSVNVDNDQEVQRGDVAFTIADPTKFEASIVVSEQNIAKVKTGEQATVQVEVLSGVSLPATVSYVSPTATISSSVVNYEVRVELESLSSIISNQTTSGNSSTSGNTSANRPSFGGAGQFSGSDNLTQEQKQQIQQYQQARESALASVHLAQGMTVTVSIITAQAINVLLVPTQAISTQGTQTTVQVLVNGVAETRQVRTGISNSSYTQINSGLNEGDEVVVSSSSSSSAQQTTRAVGGEGGLFFGR
jgi:multidrug efflux pump subunit AcrA (membrane-fusion protein)